MKNHLKLISLPMMAALLLTMVCCKKEESVKQATLSTLSVDIITSTFARCGGKITDEGGADITSRGLVWGTTPNPTAEQNIGLTTDGRGRGLYRSEINGLQSNTTYYVRAYATNSAGMVYGNEQQFTTTEGVTDIDGNYYPSVFIGNQEWMTENLRVTRDSNGDIIDRYCYNEDETNCDLYGGLYTWNTVMNGVVIRETNPSNVQGICPTGWHVPSDAEWTELVDYLVAQGYTNLNVLNNTLPGAGNALKSRRQIGHPDGVECTHPRWNYHSIHYGIDEFGFSALPGGYRSYSYDGSYYSLGIFGLWWSSTEYSTSNAWCRNLYYDYGVVSRHYVYSKDFGFSVRCVRDN